MNTITRRLVESVTLPGNAGSPQTIYAMTGPRVNEKWRISSIVIRMVGFAGATTLATVNIRRAFDVIASEEDPQPASANDRTLFFNLANPLELYPGESIGYSFGSAVTPASIQFDVRGERDVTV